MNTQTKEYLSKLFTLNKNHKKELKKSIDWKYKAVLSAIGLFLLSPYFLFLFLVKTTITYNSDVIPVYVFFIMAFLIFCSCRKFYKSKIIKTIPGYSLQNCPKIVDELNEISISPLEAKKILGKKSFIDWNIIEEYRQQHSQVIPTFDDKTIEELNKINLCYQKNMDEKFKNIHKVLCVAFSTILYFIGFLFLFVLNQGIIQTSESLHTMISIVGTNSNLLSNSVVFFLFYPSLLFMLHLLFNKRLMAFSHFIKRRCEKKYIHSVSKVFEGKISALNLSLDNSEEILNKKFIYHFKNIK